jgi:hypothetical protein
MTVLKTLFAATILVAAASAVAGPASALSAAVCRTYANSAVKDFADMRRRPQCARDADARWQDNYAAHYGWCKTTTTGIKAERAARERDLLKCGARIRFD